MTLAIAFALLAAAGWGTSAVLARLGLQHMGSSTGTVVSLASGVLLIGAIAFAVYGRGVFAIDRVAFLWIIALGIIAYPMGRLLNYTGLRLAGVGRTEPILSGAPLVAVTLGLLAGGESINLPIALGTLSIVTGVLLIVSQRSH
ncbi:MAG: DMT family transporter [Chloroflexi bacterium]|nr:DMT family transporter [Chloroflexota bacterium]MBI4198098.1 DMT family transporter [Chloroflexota bacterium]